LPTPPFAVAFLFPEKPIDTWLRAKFDSEHVRRHSLAAGFIKGCARGFKLKLATQNPSTCRKAMQGVDLRILLGEFLARAYCLAKRAKIFGLSGETLVNVLQ
jgi:hypothetical protein